MRKWLSRSQGFLFTLPALLALAALIVYPLIDSVFLSVTNEDGGFVGARNYAAVLSDPITAMSAGNSIFYVLGSAILQIVLGTVAGVLLNQKFALRGALRTALLVPWVVPGIVAATTWAWMFHSEFGIISFALKSAHLIDAPVGWLTDPKLVLPSLMAVNIWKMFPFVAVMVLAGLQSIPAELYEAARVDGATFLDEVRYIMLPLLRPVLGSVSLLLLIWGMNGITIIYTMTNGGPANRSLILPIQIFKQAFEQFDFNGAAALSLVLFAALFAAIVLQIVLSRRAGTDNA